MDQNNGISPGNDGTGGSVPVVVHHKELVGVKPEHLGKEIFVLYSEAEWEEKVRGAKNMSNDTFSRMASKFRVTHDVHRLGNGWIVTSPKCPKDGCRVTLQQGTNAKGHGFMYYQPECHLRMGLQGKDAIAGPTGICAAGCAQGSCMSTCIIFQSDAVFACSCPDVDQI